MFSFFCRHINCMKMFWDFGMCIKTIVEASLQAVRNGENPDLTIRQKHIRECFVVLEDGAEPEKVENEIKTMPNYFAKAFGHEVLRHFLHSNRQVQYQTRFYILSVLLSPSEKQLWHRRC